MKGTPHHEPVSTCAPGGPGRGPGGRRYLLGDRTATCAIPWCAALIDPSRLMCRRDWYQVPKALRDRVWATWRSGSGAISADHARAIAAAIAAVAGTEFLARR